jgi:DNA polymerase-3 subunit alpha (Gram-positive type)
MVKDQPRATQALEGFSHFCGDTILVAHNAPFDVKFMGTAMKANQTAAPTGLVFDTYSIAKQAMPDLFNHRLEGLVKHFEITSEGFHRAEADSVYCGKVFLKLLAHIKSKGQKLSFQNVINLSGGELRFPKVELETSQLGLL